MTATRLAQRDQLGEVRSWLETIGRLAQGDVTATRYGPRDSYYFSTHSYERTLT